MSTATLTYKETRKALFGSTETVAQITTELPKVKLAKRFHVYVQVDPGTEMQPVDSSRTIEEAKAIIQEECEVGEPPVNAIYQKLFSGYTDGMVFRVKDVKENTTYTYNPRTLSLELDLA